MKIDFLSDIHFEFFNDNNEIINRFKERFNTDSDYLIIAGDITPGLLTPKMINSERVKELFEFFKNKYKQVFVVLGNHDYWAGDIANFVGKIKLRYKDYFTVLENDTVDMGEFVIYGATMWTNTITDPNAKLSILFSMNDYRFITNRGKRVLVENLTDISNDTQKMLGEFLESTKKPCIVVTHHAPSMRSGSKKFAQTRGLNGSDLVNAYCNNLDSFIEQHPNIKVWVHGHVHNSVNYKINDTLVVANPFGYINIERDSNTFETCEMECATPFKLMTIDTSDFSVS